MHAINNLSAPTARLFQLKSLLFENLPINLLKESDLCLKFQDADIEMSQTQTDEIIS